MPSLVAFTSLLGLSSALAVPFFSENKAELVRRSLQGRDGSNGCQEVQPLGGSTPGVDYFDGSPGGCPIVNTMSPDGSCDNGLDLTNGEDSSYCAGYCEVKNAFFYGAEVVFTEFAGCRANSPCTFTSTKSLTITQTWTFNADLTTSFKHKKDEIPEATRTVNDKRQEEGDSGGLEGSFNLGASYSYSTAKTSSTGLALTRPTNSTQYCGYWTFVPIFWTSCGSYSTSAVTYTTYSGYESAETYSTGCDNTTSTTVGNYCNTYPYLDDNGNQAGETVFVLVGCSSNIKQPAFMQDPIYTYPGVASDPLPSTVQP